MVVDYKIVNGTQVAVISDIENANLTAEQWKQFADMIGGDIKINSEKGRGTTAKVMVTFDIDN